MRRFLALAFCILARGCLNTRPEELGVWSEFVPYNDVRSYLAALAALDADLYLAVRPDSVDDNLWVLIDKAKRLDVSVRPCLQLPRRGVWLNEHNVAEFADSARYSLAQAHERGQSIDWLVFDLEPEFAYAQAGARRRAGPRRAHPAQSFGRTPPT